MRTVHETEALRPSDPIPKGMQPSNRNLALKSAAKHSHAPSDEQYAPNGIANGNDVSGWTSSYPAELGFTAEEEASDPQELFRSLRRQVQWAEEEGVLLKKQSDAMEEFRKNEWREKEVLLDQVIRSEADWYERRQEVLAGLANLPSAEAIKAAAAMSAASRQGSIESPTRQPVDSNPANDQPVAQERDADAAAALASLSQA